MKIVAAEKDMAIAVNMTVSHAAYARIITHC